MKVKFLSLAILFAAALCCVPADAQITYSLVAIDSSTNPAVPVPNLAPTLFNAISSKGQAVVLGTSAGTFLNGKVDGLWAGPPGAAQLLALDGTPAPGVEPDALFLIFDNFNFQGQDTDYSINSSGQVVLRAALRGSATADNNLGLWVGAPGALQLVARKGSAAPDTEAGTVFSDISPGTAVGLPGPAVNASGQVAFAASLSGPSVNANNGSGIWAGAPGSLRLVLRGSGFLADPLLNDAGEVAFSTAAGIWTGAPGATQLLVRFANPAPGLPGVTLQTLSGTLAFNNAGQVAFPAILSGTGVVATNNRSLWSASGGSVNLLARTGTQAPGVNAGVVFSDFPGTITLAAGTVPVLNGAGQVAFVAKLAGPGVTAMNDSGIWLATSGNVQLVAREGDPVPGTVDGVTFPSFISTQPALNDKGEIAFLALNTTIFVGKPGALQIVARTGTQIDAGNGVTGLLTILGKLYTGLGSSQGGHSPGIGENGEVLFSGSIVNANILRNAVLMATPGPGTGSGDGAPRILSIVKTDNDVQIRFTTQPGKLYTLESNDELNPVNWGALPGNLTASGTEATITDASNGKGATRFYRIRTQ
jgi:hypothetical protein